MKITPKKLRKEGVLEIGRAPDTQLCFVRTKKRLHIFHAKMIPDRALDDYAISLAVNWLEFGHSNYEVAANLGIDPNYLSRELAAAGYERISLQDGKARVGADARDRRAKRKRAKVRAKDQKSPSPEYAPNRRALMPELDDRKRALGRIAQKRRRQGRRGRLVRVSDQSFRFQTTFS